MRQHIVRIALGLLIVLAFVGHAAELYSVGFITQLDNIIYDARLRFTMPGKVDERIVILDIDEKSLAVPELGRWPWSRDDISALIDKLYEKYGIGIVGFDVVFAELLHLIEILDHLCTSPVTISYYNNFRSEEHTSELQSH